jgi:serine/threonine-protein kinase
MTSEDPTSLRSYRLIAEIGRGGMADIFLAVARGPAGFNKLVVVKKTRRDLVAEGDVLAMFLDEARLAARMNHPNVVQTHEIGQEGDGYFIAMEYLDGQPFSRVLSRLQRRVPLALQIRVLTDTLAGLHHAHELRDFDGTALNVVHRDATPQNVFITYDGSIKVVDFGIAKALDSSAQTSLGVVKGKVTYMSPEQVRGEPLDRRTDVFAVGVMLWEAIAGRRMWDGLPEPTVVHELMYDHVPSIRAAAPGVPPALAAICDRAVAPQREQRHGSALELHRDLEGYLRSTGEPASAREVGEFIAQAFESERQRVRGIIESQLHDVRWTGVHARSTTSDLPTIDVHPNSLALHDPAASGSQPRLLLGPSTARSPDYVAATSAPGSLLPERPSQPLPAAGTHSVVPTNGGAALPLPAPPAARPRSLLVPAIVAVVASIGVVVLDVKVLVGGDAQHAATAPSGSAPPPVTAPASAEAPPEVVTLTVRGKPADARVYLDGVLLSIGPFEGKVRISAKPRVVRVEAERYVAKEEQVILASDLVVTFDLEKKDARPATEPGPGPRPGANGGRPAVKPKHDIDPDSPYKK